MCIVVYTGAFELTYLHCTLFRAWRLGKKGVVEHIVEHILW